MFLYNIGLFFYVSLLHCLAPIHSKARKWVQGRKHLWQKLGQALQGNQKPVVWFHVSSLGEFEQARPVIEGLRAREGDSFFLLLTFFSPSGYEVRKNYAHADYITYLPTDLPAQAKRWLDMVKPTRAFWVKYDFWWNVLQEMQARKVPITLFSAVFREEQFFFKSSAQKYLTILKNFTQIFVQNQESLALLDKYGFQNATIAGDTRFDRVLGTVENFEPIPLVENWLSNADKSEGLLVMGSVWERDLEVILPVLAQNFPKLRLIFAPHEMHERIFHKIELALPAQTIRFSQLELLQTREKSVRALLIDNVGMLSRLYHYGNLAYIGGAFKEGLHNILEPAVFGMPVIFGKDYRKFPEAFELIKVGGGFSIKNATEFSDLVGKFLSQEQERAEAGKAANLFIVQNRGGANKILETVFGK